MAGAAIHDWWTTTLGQPHGMAHLLQDGSVGRLHSASEVLRNVGAHLMHRLIDVGFAFVTLFFFYKDGPALVRQLNAIGSHCVGRERWTLYATKVPVAVRATVNGLVLVGLAEGVLLGIVLRLRRRALAPCCGAPPPASSPSSPSARRSPSCAVAGLLVARRPHRRRHRRRRAPA